MLDATLSAYRDYVVAPDRFRGKKYRVPSSWLNFRVGEKKKNIEIPFQRRSSGRLVTTRDTAHTGARARTGNAFSRLTVTASVRVNVLTGAYLTVLDE